MSNRNLFQSLLDGLPDPTKTKDGWTEADQFKLVVTRERLRNLIDLEPAGENVKDSTPRVTNVVIPEGYLKAGKKLMLEMQAKSKRPPRES